MCQQFYLREFFEHQVYEVNASEGYVEQSQVDSLDLLEYKKIALPLCPILMHLRV